MPKPFFKSPFIRNFVGIGSKTSRASIPYDRRVDWVSRVPPPPPPPPPTFTVLARGGTIEYQGYEITIDTSTQALISAQEGGQLALFGSRATSTIDAAIEGTMHEIVSYSGALKCNGTFVPALIPSDISNLVAWYDAQDLSTVINQTDSLPVESGDSPAKIEAWNDKVGSNDLVEILTTHNPAWVYDSGGGADSINDLPTVSFDGIDNYLRCASPGSEFDNVSDWTIMSVVKDDGGGDYFAITTTTGDYTFRVAVIFGSTDQAAVWDGTTWVGASNAWGPSGAHWHSGKVYDYGTAIRCESRTENKNIFSGTLTDPGVDTADSLVVGCRLNIGTGLPESWFDGGVGEILVYDRQLNTPEIDDLALYFQRKWGI